LSPRESERENPRIVVPGHVDALDPVVQRTFGSLGGLLMPTPIRNFDGTAEGTDCSFWYPPDTNGEAGATQYVQVVNKCYQVFDKNTGVSVLGPANIASIWSGFGGL